MDDDIEFDDYSEEEEDVADIDAVSGLLEKIILLHALADINCCIFLFTCISVSTQEIGIQC